MSTKLGKLECYLEFNWPSFTSPGQHPVDVAIRAMKHLDQEYLKKETGPRASASKAVQESYDAARVDTSEYR